MRLRISTCLTLLLAATAPCQDDRTTLTALLDGADAVAVARVVRVDGNDAALLRVTLLIDERLRGELPATLDLAEARGRGCGRALTAVMVGQRFLACLQRRNDEWRLCAGGTRALPLAGSSVLAHARVVLAAGQGPSRLAVLLGALTADDERVRTDAALALPLEPALERADGAQRAAVIAALQAALARDQRAVPALLGAATRLRLAPAIDLLLPDYLDGNSGAFERLFRDSMVRIDSTALATRIAARIPGLSQPLARARATTLLLEIDTEAARAPLLELARQASERGTRLRACAGLLRLGVDERDLHAVADQELLELARRAAQPTAPRLRSIRTE